MTSTENITVGIVGIGLIGGSMALGLKKSGFAQRVIAVDRNPAHGAEALALGLADEALPLQEAIRICDVLIVATPVESIAHILPGILDQCTEKSVVLDVGSTKIPILESVAHHPLRHRYVATHPMAGTEYSGPKSAVEGLFQGKCCVFCETEHSAPDAVQLAEKLYRALGMHLTWLDGKAHDLHTAYVSHISHIAAFALALTVLEKEKQEEQIFELASGGFGSTVRLAKSNPETWIPIFRQNRDNVLDVLDEFINTVSRFRTLLIKRDFDTFQTLIEQANDIKRIIDK